jgi:hypothetical protein
MDSDGSDNKFQYKHTMILYLISEGFKKGVINDEEKTKMKLLVMAKYPKVYQLLNSYQEDGKVEKFWIKFKEIAYKTDYSQCHLYTNTEDDNDMDSTDHSKDEMNDAELTLSSPPDTSLIRQKKINWNKNKQSTEEGVKEAHSNVGPGSPCSFSNMMKECKQGFSPKISFNRLNQ